MLTVSKKIFSPAKINLFLAIDNLRNDGFHNLVSVIAPLAWGDTLYVTWNKMQGKDQLFVKGLPMKIDSNNLVLKAAKAYRKYCKFNGYFNFYLDKKIPIGSGLGGGSSNAVAAIQGMQSCLGYRLSDKITFKIAQQLGSDCVFFLHNQPIIVREKGDSIEFLTRNEIEVLKGKKILVFKPNFKILTKNAYKIFHIDRNNQHTRSQLIEKKLNQWRNYLTTKNIIQPYNDFNVTITSKYIALDILLKDINKNLNVFCEMSGSGSACFAIIDKNR